MPAPLEKQPSPYIHNGEKVESQATPEVKADIAVIAAFEQQIGDTLGFEPGSEASVRETDDFLVASAEKPGATPDDVEVAVVAGALEATGERFDTGEDNPITVLELDGYGTRLRKLYGNCTKRMQHCQTAKKLRK